MTRSSMARRARARRCRTRRPRPRLRCARPTSACPSTVVATATTSRRASVVGVGDVRPVPARAVATRVGDDASRPRPTRACAASASACTQAIDEPGMMSWNCWSSTSFHERVELGGDLGRHRRRQRPPQLGLAQQPLAPAVADLRARLRWSACRGASRSTARRPTPAPARRRRPRPRPCRRTRSTVPSCMRGSPSRSAIRRARSSISRVGPPPPLPWPNGISDQSLQPCSLKLRLGVAHLARRDLRRCRCRPAGSG